MFVYKEINKYPHITCAFFSRKKGVSNGVYKSLNCGLNSQDKKNNVLKNRIIALKKIGAQSAVKIPSTILFDLVNKPSATIF